MSVRTDVINLNVNINGNVAQNQLIDLRRKAADIALEMKGLKKGTQEYIDANRQLSQVTAEMNTLKQSIGITSLNQKELTVELKKLTALKSSVQPFTKEFKDLQTQINAVNSRLYDVRNGTTGLASVFSKLGDSVKQFGVLAAGYLGFQFITSQFQNIIQGAGKLSDQLADLRRVAGLTAEEATNLNSALGKIDTRTSVTNLRDIATIAGKLGVAKEDIFGFTKAVDQLVVSLGDELGSADEITTSLGKILNVFDGKITGDNITKLGNAFVELANTGAATGGFIADFDQRLSGMAKAAGIGLGALSGLGAGLEEMGSRVESSTTAIQKLLVSIASDIPKAAKIAGESTEEFDKLFKTDPTEALLRFSQGLVKDKQSFAEVTASLHDAGEEGVRVIETLTKMGTGADHLRERINLGKEAIQENSAITEAFALKNETLGATLDKLGKVFYAFVQSSGVSTFLKGAVQNTIDFIKWMKDLPQFIQENRIAISAVVTAFLLYNKQLIISNALWLVNKAAVVAGTVAQYAAAAATLAIRTATLAFAAAQALASGNITRARAAWELLTKAFKASPIGLIVAGVVALAIALDNAFSKTSNLQKAQEDFQKKSIENYGDQVNKIEELKKALDDEGIGLETKKKLYNELIALNPAFAETLRLDAQGHLNGATAIDTYIKALKRKGDLEAAQELSNEKNKEILSAQSVIDGLSPKLKSGNYSAQDLIKLGNADAQIKAAKEAKKYFDDQIQEIYKVGTPGGSNEFAQPADTTVPGAIAKEDPSVAARRKELEKLIADSKTAYELLNANDKAGQQANLALRAKYQKELDALDNKKAQSKDNSEYKRLKKEAEDFYKQILKLKEDAINASKSDDEKERIAVENKYKDLQAKALDYFKRNLSSRGQFNEETKALTEAFNIELSNLQKKYFDQSSADEYAQSLQDTEDYYDHQKNLAGQSYADGKIDKEQYSQTLEQLDLSEKKQRVQVAEDYSKTVKKAAQDVHDFKKDLEKSTTDNEISESEKRKKNAEEEKAKKEKDAKEAADKAEALKQSHLRALQELGQDTVDLMGGFIQSISNLDQRALQKDKLVNDAKKNNYKKQLDSKLLSQKQYDKLVAAADAEMDKKKQEAALKEFKRQQALSITTALINGALAVTSTLAARPGMSDLDTFGISRAVQVALVIATTAAQIAAIATQAPPEAGDGNWFREGDKHSDPSGGIPVMIERDEAVVKADTMTDKNQYTVTGTPSQITSKLNSMHGGVNWETGATIQPKFRQRPAQINPNMPFIMANGGLIGRSGQAAVQTLDTTNLERMMENKFDEFFDRMPDKNTPIHAELVLKQFRETEKKYDNAKKSSGMSQ